MIWLGAWALMQFAGTEILLALLAAAVVYLPLVLISMAGRTVGMSFLHLKVARIDSGPLSTGDKLAGVLTRKTRIVSSD